MSTIDTIFRGSGAREQEATMAKQNGRTTFTSMLGWIEIRLERRRSRRALLEMTDDQLKDIGISRGEAYQEANRPLWL